MQNGSLDETRWSEEVGGRKKENGWFLLGGSSGSIKGKVSSVLDKIPRCLHLCSVNILFFFITWLIFIQGFSADVVSSLNYFFYFFTLVLSFSIFYLFSMYFLLAIYLHNFLSSFFLLYCLYHSISIFLFTYLLYRII